MDQVILQMKGICKAFAGVPALCNASLELKSGEVHALLGENGAGKSTLMKILTGIYHRDGGTILFDGQEVVFDNPRQAQEAGIVIVHQELNMMHHLTVAQNLFIGREVMKYGIFTDDGAINRRARELFQLLNIDIDPTETMGHLTVGRQQMVEIAKAISTRARVIVFDEPTAALTDAETTELFKIIRDLKSKGMGIVYISHRMDELAQITDRVTVMRDGEYVGTLVTAESSKAEIIKMMVGRTVFEAPKEKSNVPPQAPVVLSVRNLCAGFVRDVSFDLHKGEILGFAGLMGAGRTEVARALFGADPQESGEILIQGEKVQIRTPQDAVQHGIGYLSEDRKRYGLVVEKTVQENSLLAAMEKHLRGIFIDTSRNREEAKQYVDRLRIKTPSVEQRVVTLSGGNQQKVVIAKWLIRDCDILIFDEPTRGIDVGAKSEIYALMNELVAKGKSIIMISSELPEILRMSDRVIIMSEGRRTGELSIEEASQEKIMHYATLRENETA